MRAKVILFLFMLFSCAINAQQTNPSPQNLPYSLTSHSGSTLPAGVTFGRFGTSSGSIPLFRTTALCNADLPYSSSNISGGWQAEAANGVSMLASGTNAAGAMIVAINTTGLSNINVSWICRTIFQQAVRDNSIALQYRVGTSGNFIDVGTTTTYSSAGNATGHSSGTFTEVLPAAADNQPVVQVRWIYWESVSTSGSRDRVGVDDISITGSAAGCSTVNPGSISSSTGINICGPGTTTTLTLGGGVSTGTGISYVWQSSADSINWTPISGTTTTNGPLTFTSTTYFRAITTCATSGLKDSASIGIHINPAPFASISGATAICSGDNTDITFTGTDGATVTYDINNGPDLTAVLTGGTATINTGALTANTSYRLINVINGPCTQTYNTTVVVTVNPLPTAALNTSSAICIGGNTDVTFTGTPNAIITYNINGGASATVTLDGAGTATVNTGTLNADAVYTLEGASLGTCSQTLTGSTTVTVIAIPTAVISGTTTICNGGNADITFTGTPNAIVTYTINGGAPLTVTLDGSGNALVNTGVLSADVVYDLVSIASGACSQVLTGSVAITINTPSATIAGTTTVCGNANTNITFTGTPNATVTYTINGGSNVTVVLDASGNASVNTGTLTADATYALVDVTSGPCVAALTGNAVVTVNNPTASISGTTTICSGGNADITFTGSANATVTYTVNGVPQSILLDGAGNGVVNTGVLTANTAFVLVDVTSGSCTNTLTGSAVVTVGSPIAAISGPSVACEGNSATITFAGTPNGVVTYNIDGGAPLTVTLDGSGDATVSTGVLTTNTVYTLESIDAGTCSALLTGSVSIVVNPMPVATIAGTTTICAGSNTDITFTGTANSVVTYTINGGANTDVTLNGAGIATVNTGNLSANAVYALVSVSLNSCSQAQIGTATVTVDPMPTATIAGTTTICAGSNANITFTGTANAVVTYTINGGANTTVTLNGAGTATVNTGTLSANAVYALVSTSLNSCSQSLTGTATVTVNPMPAVTIAGTTTICAGSNADITFTGTANAVVTYNINGGANTTVTLNGAGTATVNTGNLSANAVYTLVSVSLNSCSQPQIGTATVTVNTMPVASISGSTTICSGNNANITFTGTPNAVVTYTINGGANTTVTLNGAGTATVNTGSITANAVYALVSAELVSCSQPQTGTVIVTVNPLPTAAIAGTTTICAGNNTNITFTGTPNAVVTYTVNGGPNTTVTLNGAGTATVNTGNLSTTATYTLVSATLNSCTQALSGTAVVTVNPVPTATIAGTVTICSGNNANITFTGTANAVVTYTINGGANTTVTLNGAGTATVNTGNLSANAVYALVSASLNSCSQSLTGSATVTVNPLPTATIAGTTTICAGNNTNITFTGTANAVVTYTINGGANTTVTLDGAGIATVNTGNISATATYALVSVTLNSCPQTLSGSAVVTVNPVPTASVAGTTTICSGNAVNITFVGTPNSVVTYNVNGGANTTVTLSAGGIATVNTGTLTATATYALVSVSLNSCSQTLSGTAVVTVSPLPTATIAGTTTVCSGDNANITFTGTANAVVTYTINGGPNTTITLNGAGTATVNTGTLTTNAVYTLVSASLNSCSQAQSGTATVTVAPLPTATISGTVTICNGSDADIAFSGTPNAIVTYTINGGPNTTVTLNGAGTAVVNTGSISANAVYSLVSASLNSCSQSQSGTATVTVNPLPTAAISGTTAICSGGNTDITFTGTPNAVVTYNIDGGANTTVTLDGAGNAIVNTGAITANTTYFIVDAVLNGCTQGLSGSAVVTVNTLPTATISGTATICSGDNTDVTFTGTPNAVVTYTVNSASQTLTLDASGNATVNTGTLTSNVSYDMVSVSEGICSQNLSGNAAITVTPLPTATISGTTAICSGTDADITFSGTPNAIVTYTVNGGANQTVTLDAAGNATVNTGNLTADATYALVSVNGGLCSNNITGTATVSVNIIPTATISGTTTICSGNNANIVFDGTPNAIVYYTINSGPQQSVALDAAGDAVVNTGMLTGNATYALTSVVLNICSANLTGNAMVTVSPAPTVAISGTISLAAGNATDITFTGTPNAIVSYTINGGSTQTVTLDGTGNAVVSTGVLYYDLTYALVDITLGCTTGATGSAVVTVTTGYGTLYSYTNATNGDFNFVATNATASDLTLFNGSVLSTSPCPNGYTTEGYTNASTYDPVTNRAVVAKITPDGLRRLVITGFSVAVRRSADGPQHVRLAYSLDSGATWINSGVDELPNNGVCGSTTTLTWNTAPFQVMDGPDGIMFAVFGFDAATASGQLQILDLAVNGAVIETPLPVTLTYFKGKCVKGTMTFNWGVAYENNISEYRIEHSANGKDFTTVATMAVDKSGNGSKEYSNVQYDAPEGLYRLVSVEMSGNEAYSNVVTVKCNDAVVTVPTVVNVMNGSLNIWAGSEFTQGENVTVQLFSMNGQLLGNYTKVCTGSVQKQEVSLPAGLYVVRLVQGGVVSAHKVMID